MVPFDPLESLESVLHPGLFLWCPSRSESQWGDRSKRYQAEVKSRIAGARIIHKQLESGRFFAILAHRADVIWKDPEIRRISSFIAVSGMEQTEPSPVRSAYRLLHNFEGKAQPLSKDILKGFPAKGRGLPYSQKLWHWLPARSSRTGNNQFSRQVLSAKRHGS